MGFELPDCYLSSFGGTKLISGRSDFHNYEFRRHTDFGICLFLDGVLQSAESDQHIYHEKLVRAALEENPAPDDILIIGGAGGGVLHHLFKTPDLNPRRVVIVDIDEALFKMARDIMRTWGNNEFDDPRVEIIFANGRDYLERLAASSFDAIILDVGDPLPHTKSSEIFSKSVLRDLGRTLKPDGVVAFHTAPEFTSENIFVKESIQSSSALGKMSHFFTEIPSFEREWVFNTLKKQSL